MKKLLIALSLVFSFNLLEAQVAKKVIVEHFTNTLCSVCKNRNPGFYSNLANQTNTLHLSIHSSVPYNQCLLYQQNTASSNARKTYYSVTGTPKLFINGFDISTSTNYSDASLFTPFKNQTSPISIRMEQAKYGNDSMHVRVIVKTEASHSLGTQQLWVGVAEDTVFYSAPNGESRHYDVFRSELNLSTITVPSTVGDSLVYDYTVFSNVNWDFSRMFAFALVQNTSNKYVNQSEATSPNTNNLLSSNLLLQSPELNNVSIYPNPTNGELTIELEDDELTQVQLFDLMGRELKTETMQYQTSLQLGDLPKGVYYVRLTNEKGQAMKSIIYN